ncbi:hypothetical protein V6N12_068125 [Hibiscus sabdariffa]|uniref:Uncharacterized protein n=1 Tax=Hibiscus sabdariffa TaxID=183260 RepID=A0ABR2FP26_9ROSI
MLQLHLCKCFDNLLRQDDKGDVSVETTGPAQAVILAGLQTSAERLAVLLAELVHAFGLGHEPHSFIS